MSIEQSSGRGVLLVYTGGTIGSVRKNRGNPDSPLRPAESDVLMSYLPEIQDNVVSFEGEQVEVALVQTDEFFDSSLVRPQHWIEIAEIIEERYDDYEGFVVLHGTDTMAYTASALAFMIDHLDKPIILTGAQRPIGATRSDAAQNVLTAIEIAAARSLGGVVVPEVCIYFRDHLLRGCRSTKYDADGYTGFTSPNYPPLGVAGSNIEINEDLILQADEHDVQFRTEFDRGVAVLELSPLMHNDLFERVLDSDGLNGVILKTYGAGNAPDGKFLDIVEAAIARGVKIVAVTLCHAGTVRLGQYDVSTGMLERGVISGMDMTPEAAQTKLALLLADSTGLFPAEELMQVNLKGEMDGNLFDVSFEGGEAAPLGMIMSEGTFPAAAYYHQKRIEKATLRMSGIRFPDVEKAEEKLSIFVGGKKINPENVRYGTNFAGSRLIDWDIADEEKVSLYIDVTHAVRRHLDAAKRNTVTVLSETGDRVVWTNAHLAIFTL